MAYWVVHLSSNGGAFISRNGWGIYDLMKWGICHLMGGALMT